MQKYADHKRSAAEDHLPSNSATLRPHAALEEKIPWKCHRLVIGTGAYGRLPVMDELQGEAKRRKIELLILPTREAMEVLNEQPEDKTRTPVLHVTC